MNLTKDMAECLLTGAEEAALPIKMPMSKEICEDWLAMRKTLEEVNMRAEFCPWCGDGNGECEPDCKLKELLG